MTPSLTASEVLCKSWPRGAIPPLAAVRQRVAQFLSGLGREVVIDVQLVCNELMTNVYQHARTAGQIRVAERALERVVRVEVDDESRAMPKRVTRGRGLLLVNGVARRWGAHRTRRGKTVWVDIPIH
jgi:anti-sigma regulatory factor (Ser/Thr protein kinase)